MKHKEESIREKMVRECITDVIRSTRSKLYMKKVLLGSNRIILEENLNRINYALVNNKHLSEEKRIRSKRVRKGLRYRIALLKSRVAILDIELEKRNEQTFN